jgi:GntR family transcriptional regulator, transcriptional repressor for pyruvate dehydrogenase complex
VDEKGAQGVHISQAPRRKLAETVAQQILEAVRDLAPGTRLPPERELTTQLGVGRSTVREALNGLAMMGVVEIRHGQGVFVADRPAIAGDAERSLPPKEVTDELLEARRIIEVELARLAAERRTESDLATMQSLLDAHRADLAGGRGPIMQASQFHLLVADAAKNQILADVVRPFFRLMLERGPQLYETTDGYAQWELEQHQRICDAIRSGDAGEARLRMLEHVTSMGHHYEAAVEASQERTS